MKKTIIPALAIILLAGCTEDNGHPGIEPGQDGRVPITLSTVSATTKAPVNTGDGFTAGIAGWESDATADYTAVPTWYNTAEITASTSPAGITLNPARTYHADPSVKTYMAAWHPAGEPADGLVTFANPDGQVDAMTATPVSGSARDYEGKPLAVIGVLRGGADGPVVPLGAAGGEGELRRVTAQAAGDGGPVLRHPGGGGLTRSIAGGGVAEPLGHGLQGGPGGLGADPCSGGVV